MADATQEINERCKMSLSNRSLDVQGPGGVMGARMVRSGVMWLAL